MKSNNKSKSKSTKSTKMTKNEKQYYELCRKMEALKLDEK
jgi:hypothetical protein